MTRFKNALLDELLAYTQLPAPAPAVRPARSRLTQVVRVGALAGAGAAVVVAAWLVASSGQQPAYAVDKNPDGTVTITVRELGHAAEATRDLRAAGVAAQVVRLAAPGSCATTPGGTPLQTTPSTAYHIGMPNIYPFDGAVATWLPRTSPTSWTINPAAIPPGAVLFIIESSSPQTGIMITGGLAHDPAPTCWEATISEPGPKSTRAGAGRSGP